MDVMLNAFNAARLAKLLTQKTMINDSDHRHCERSDWRNVSARTCRSNAANAV